MRTVLLAVLASSLLSACGEEIPGPPAPDTWQAAMVGTAAAPGVTGTATATVGNQQTAVSLQIAGLPAGSERPWHIHFGSCAAAGDIVGDPEVYGLLPAAGGNAQRQATIGVALRRDESYLVFVHESMERMDIILACGDLELS